MSTTSTSEPTEAAGPDVSAPSTSRLSERLERLDQRLKGRLALYTIIGAVGVGWVVRFAQDDGYITYRYARNLSRGLGLVFERGERVEGYTSFLWAVLHAIPEKLGWSPTAFTTLIGLPLLALALYLLYRLSAHFVDGQGMRLLALAVLSANMTFLAYGTGGMETMLQTALVLAVAVLLSEAPLDRVRGTLAWAAAGVCTGLALLTRLDSVLLVGTWFVVALVAWFRPADERPRPVGDLVGRLAAAAVPAALLVVPWLVWKQDFYGSILPNTLTAKSGFSPLWRIAWGAFYLLCFFLSYGAFLLVPRLRKLWRDRRSLSRLAPLAAVICVWFAYIMWVGADFMEFRFVVPVIPYLAVFGAVVIDPVTRHTKALVISLVLLSALHRVVPPPVVPVVSIKGLNDAVQDGTQAGLGRHLRQWFADEDPSKEPVLATSTLGAISYFSDLPVVDTIGLVDPGIAKHAPNVRIYYPGHLRMATIEQLEDRDVTLMLGTALPADRIPDRTSYDIRELIPTWPVVDLGDLPEDARVVEIPYAGGVLPVIQLQPQAKVDEVVERKGWRTFPLDRSCDGPGPDDPLVKIVTFTHGTGTCQ